MPGPQAAAGIKQWFDGHDEHEDDGSRVRAMHGAGPSRHGAAVLSAGHRQGHEAGSATAVPLLQAVAKDHRRMAAPPSSKKVGVAKCNRSCHWHISRARSSPVHCAAAPVLFIH